MYILFFFHYVPFRKLSQLGSNSSLLLSSVCVWTFLEAQMVKNLSAMQETWVWSLGWEDPMEEDIVILSSISTWRIPMDFKNDKQTNDFQKKSTFLNFLKEVIFPCFHWVKVDISFWLHSIFNVLHKECLSLSDDHSIPLPIITHKWEHWPIKICSIHWKANRMLVKAFWPEFWISDSFVLPTCSNWEFFHDLKFD